MFFVFFSLLMCAEERIIDQYGVRYTTVKKLDGNQLDFVILPGGPGADSAYCKGLIESVNFPGNVYLMDLPGSGSNTNVGPDYDYNEWLNIFIPSLKRFKNLVLIGHSFGGMLPLLFPCLETKLKGFIAIDSAPSLWVEEAVKYAKKFNVPDLTKELTAFNDDPCQKKFDVALNACMPYYFHPDFLTTGKALLADLPFQYRPACWWQHKSVEMNYDARWIPKTVPTLIINGDFDLITPYYLFSRDKRFERPNIKIVCIADAGHMPWVEQPEKTRNTIMPFVQKLSQDLKKRRSKL